MGLVARGEAAEGTAGAEVVELALHTREVVVVHASTNAAGRRF